MSNENGFKYLNRDGSRHNRVVNLVSLSRTSFELESRSLHLNIAGKVNHPISWLVQLSLTISQYIDGVVPQTLLVPSPKYSVFITLLQVIVEVRSTTWSIENRNCNLIEPSLLSLLYLRFLYLNGFPTLYPKLRNSVKSAAQAVQHLQLLSLTSRIIIVVCAGQSLQFSKNNLLGSRFELNGLLFNVLGEVCDQRTQYSRHIKYIIFLEYIGGHARVVCRVDCSRVQWSDVRSTSQVQLKMLTQLVAGTSKLRRSEIIVMRTRKTITTRGRGIERSVSEAKRLL